MIYCTALYYCSGYTILVLYEYSYDNLGVVKSQVMGTYTNAVSRVSSNIARIDMAMVAGLVRRSKIINSIR